MNRTTYKNHQSHLQNNIKDVELNVEHNANLQRSQFHGISMQRRPSYEPNIIKK